VNPRRRTAGDYLYGLVLFALTFFVIIGTVKIYREVQAGLSDLAEVQASNDRIQDMLDDIQRRVDSLPDEWTTVQTAECDHIADANNMIPPVELSVSEPDRAYLGEFTVFAYCACRLCVGQWYGHDMSIPREDGGRRPLEGYTVAVDPSVIALRSTIYIEGLGYRYAHDTGGAIKGNTLDVFMTCHDAALRFGRQTLSVWAVIP